MWLPSAPYLKLAAAIRAEVAIPILHATRITDAATAVHAVNEGLVDMVGMTRAFLADPHHVAKLRQGREAEIRPCVGAGYCVDRVLMGKDALCLHNVATGRERILGHVVERSSGPPKTVVVVGGGPITKLDDEQVQGLTLNQAVEKMRGPVNTKIRLTITRKGQDKPIEVSITRDVIRVRSVRSQSEGDDVGYIRLYAVQ